MKKHKLSPKHTKVITTGISDELTDLIADLEPTFTFLSPKKETPKIIIYDKPKKNKGLF